MRLSTSTNLFGKKLGGGYSSYKESLQRCKDAGFNVLDVNFCEALYGKTDLAKDNWKQLIYNLRDEAEKLDVEFTQSHPVFLPGNAFEHNEEMLEMYKQMMERSIIASSILDVNWAVLHPVEEKIETVFDTEASVQENMRFHGPTVELALKYNVGIAFENMIERENSKRRFSSKASELVDLVDTYNDDKIGVCWDFGHGNFLYNDQKIALRTLGKRLKATHINDNNGKEDQHMFPFHGSVDWHSILPVLTEIGYKGDFTYETHKEFDNLPEELKDTMAKSGNYIGQYCLSLA